MTELKETFAGWPAEGTVFPLKSVHLRVLEGEHPFHAAEKAAAAANWRDELARNPALFDGRMVFQHRVGFHDGVISGEGALIPYSTFLWWRRQKGGAGGIHLFAFPVLLSSDGALIAVKMGRTTANAGLVYCAAGSLDESDIVNGVCDIEANMRREVLEETGFDLDLDAVVDGALHATHVDRRITLYRLFRFSMTADEMIAAIAAHEDAEGEVETAVAIRSADPTAHRYAPAMLPLLRWHFGGNG